MAPAGAPKLFGKRQLAPRLVELVAHEERGGSRLAQSWCAGASMIA